MEFLDWPDYREQWDSVPTGRYLVGNTRGGKKKPNNSEITVCIGGGGGCGRELQSLGENVRE